MPNKIDVKEVAKTNPRVDPKQVAAARAAVRALREQGIEGQGYNLVPPFTRQVRTVDRPDTENARLFGRSRDD